MDIRFAHSADEITETIEEDPKGEYLFVKFCEACTGNDPRVAAHNLLESCEALVMDFDGTSHPGIQWRLYEQAIADSLPYLAFNRHYYNMNHVLQGLLFNNTWYGERKSLVPSEDPRDLFASHWDGSNQEAVEAMWVAAPAVGMAAIGMTKAWFTKLARSLAPRDGLKELLEHPTFTRHIFASLGFTEMVESFLNHHFPGLHLHGSTRIAATHLVWKGDHLLGCHPNILTTPKKAKAVGMHLDKTPPSRVLGVGDSVLDAQLVPEGGVPVFLCAQDHDGLDHTRAFRTLADAWPHFDLFLRSNSLRPLVDLLTEAKQS